MIMFVLHYVFALYVFINTVIGSVNGRSSCPLWHSSSVTNGQCECCHTQVHMGLAGCEKNYVYIMYGRCMVWDNSSHEVKISRCLFTRQGINQCRNYTSYGIPANLSAPDLNYMTCNSYNRQDTQCRQCTDGYGPAAFSDGITCADCSRQRHMWVLNLLFQLTMVTLMYSIVILFQVKGSSSPFNVLITYSQLGVNALMIGSGTYTKVVCFTNHKLVLLILTLLGVWNLDFFRLVIPPLCVSTCLLYTSDAADE